MSNPTRAPFGSGSGQQQQSQIKRWVTRLIVIPLLIVTALALILAYKIHARNKAVEVYPLPVANSPLSSSSVLVFSPHPDDETLGTGGLIQQVLAAHGKVHVVFMTNGDAFRVGVSDYYQKVQVAPADYIKYGEMRQVEALKALAVLGLSSKDVTFLGYPDRGLMGMWELNWLPNEPWQSEYSLAKSNPYPDAPSYKRPYCGSYVLSDVERQIVADHPTDIYVTHPNDDHPDHCASAAYIMAAYQDLLDKGQRWVGNVNIHYFLIHRGDWPVPQGLYPQLTLRPPAAFLPLNTDWHTLPLTDSQVFNKKTALSKYVSQEEMMSRFLVSFIRKNELFGKIPETCERAKDVSFGSSKPAADGRNWPAMTLIETDPIGDSVLRDFQPAGDINAVSASYDATNVYINVNLHARLSRTVSYHLSIRPFDCSMHTSPKVIPYGFSPRQLSEDSPKSFPGGATVTWRGNNICYVLPIKSLGIANPSMIFVQSSTTFAKVVVDHTGYRPVYF